MFLVQTLNVERVVLSPKYIEEINSKVPEGTLDMVEGLREVRTARDAIPWVASFSQYFDLNS